VISIDRENRDLIAGNVSCALSRRLLPGRSIEELRNCFSALLRLFESTVPHILELDGLIFHIDLVFHRTRSLVLRRIPETVGQISLYVVAERLSKMNSGLCLRDSEGWLLIRDCDIEEASSFPKALFHV
jgi:hypothetical protein